MNPLKVSLFDVDVDALTMEQTVELIFKSINEGSQIVHSCINAYVVVLMNKDTELKNQLQQSDIVSADGKSVVWASHLFRKPLPERVPGPDLMDALMKMAMIKNNKVFLFGAEEEIVNKVASHYKKMLSPNIISGVRNGYFNDNEETEIVKQINNSGAQLLFVAIPSPAKEIFINRYRHKMPNIMLLMGVGGTFDVIAGKVKRAPMWMQNIGMEWFYRLLQEPRKMWKRYLLGNLEFLILLLKNLSKIGT
jgi:N-acetylglucosaminyldiphosphoundecaprenol N-acetyl-beta-D-mannosaminyltransferase